MKQLSLYFRLLHIALIISLTILEAGAARADSDKKDKVGIAVLDFRPRTLSPEVDKIRRSLTKNLIERLGRIKGAYVVEREVLNPLMTELTLSETGAIDPSSRRKLGKALSADLLIEGSVLKDGRYFEIEFRGYDVRSRKVVFESKRKSRGLDTSKLSGRIAEKVRKWMSSERGGVRAQSSGPKKLRTIGVFDFIHPTDPLLGSTIRSMMATEAFRIGRTALVERENLDAVLRELYLQQSGAIDPATRLRLGKLFGATWIIYGEVEDAGSDRFLLSIKTAETESGRIVLARQYNGQRVDIRGFLKKFSSELSGKLGSTFTRDGADSKDEAQFFIKRGKGPLASLSTRTEKGYERTVADLKRAIFLDPFNAKAYLKLAATFKNMYRYEEARMVLHSMIARIGPDLLTPYDLGYGYFNLGVLDWRLLDCENAIKHYRLGIKTGALGYLANNSNLFIGRTLAFLGRDKEALKAYRSVEGGNRTTAKLKIGYLLERLGRHEEAIPYYEEQAARNAKYNYEHGTGFESIHAGDRLTIIAKVKGAPKKAYRMLLEAELETHRHHHVSWGKRDKFLKENYDILDRALPKSRFDASAKSRMTKHLVKAIEILERLIREHPGHPVIPDALWLLAECHRKRNFSDHRLNVDADLFPLYLRIVDDYPEFRLADRSFTLAAAFAGTREMKRKMLLRNMKSSWASKKSRQSATLTLAHLMHSKFKDKEEALKLYRKFLEEREWMVEQGHNWLGWINEAEGGIRVIATGSYKLSKKYGHLVRPKKKKKTRPRRTKKARRVKRNP